MRSPARLVAVVIKAACESGCWCKRRVHMQDSISVAWPPIGRCTDRREWRLRLRTQGGRHSLVSLFVSWPSSVKQITQAYLNNQ